MVFDKSKLTILIVDDTTENIAILGEYLSEYRIKAARDGPSALNLLESGVIPDIILLDIMMPEMNGYEVCKRIKQNPKTKDIPVVFITAMTETADKIMGFRLGAIDYITKPFEIEEVESRIETHISLSLYRRELESLNNQLEQKVQERTHELLISRDKAEEASRLKSHFLALMSHELRTPMVGILGFSEVLMEEIKDAELNGFVSSLNESAHRLMNTLESILILTKLESQTQTVHPEVFNLPEQIDSLLKSHRLNASLKGLELSVVNNSQIEFIVLDKTMFDIIINNLVSNAIKFTKSGSVVVELFDQIIDDGPYVCLSVADTGIGIPPEKRDIIFEEFRQVYEGIGRNFEGVGLGLNLVKKYVEQMLGSIELKSELGKGSVFTVKFKQVSNDSMENRMPEEDSEGADIAPVNAALRTVEARPKVLLVEDDPTIVEVTRLFLSDIIDMDIACEGETALKMANENNYKAILMDINLGKGLSGLDVTKILRGSEKYKDTPIVAFTAFALDGDEKSFLNEGCTHYIPKPFSKKKLLDLVKSII